MGKDGIGNIVVANSIVNAYTPLTGSAAAGATTISVGSTSSYGVGDLILIIQMQGTSVNCGKDTLFPDPNSSIPTNTTYGAITNYNTCGNYEYAQINSVLSLTSFSLECALLKSYNFLGKVQVIRVPRYISLTVSGAGFITSPNWDGTTGGIAVVEVQNNAVLSSVPSFSVTGKGFRGGGFENLSTVGGANKFGHVSGVEGAYKGESIAGDTNRYKIYSGVFCRGAIANGGGGGTAHNAGGGGGSNGGSLAPYDGYGNPVAGFNAAWNLESPLFSAHVSSGGGRGGYSFSSNNQNPNLTAPGSGTWGGDARRVMGGFGGRPLDYSTGKIFMGGGGGSGDSNDGYGTGGGNGGGLVYILCYGSLTGVGTIVADGAKAANTIMAGFCTGKDGAGGGGGGGTIILNVVGITNLTAVPALSAKGGDGGNQNFGPPCFNTEAYGPGASGGGGYIAVSGALPGNSIVAGINGIVSGNSSSIVTNFPPNGATRGAVGTVSTIGAAPIITVTPTQTICTNNSATLTAASTSTAPATIYWYNVNAGGSALGSGSSFTSAPFPIAGTYTLYAGSCPNGTYRAPSIITIITGPTVTVNTPTICAGQSVTLTASGATTYTWNTGPTTNTIVVTPTITTSYTVTGTLATCSSAKTTTVTVNAIPSLTVPPASICNGQTITLTASGATTYTWNTGPTTATISVSPTVTTNYTVTGSNGTCSSPQTTTVTVNTLPSVTATSATICVGSVATLTAGGATTYTWNTGPTTSTINLSPLSTTNYTVTGNNGTCSNTQTTSIIVNGLPTVTATSATICAGQSTILTAGGSTTYTWNTGPTTSTISLSPAVTTNYTVTGNNGTCINTKTTSIVVNGLPTVTATSGTICAGQNVILTGGGATTYTWNTGPTTSTISVSPIITTNYTVTGSNGTCSNTQTTSVIVNGLPTVTATSGTICAGQSAILTGGGATTYTWNTGPTTSTISVSPIITTNYTVTGSNGTCSNTQTTSVTVNGLPVVTATSATICVGQNALLTAGGATTYTWNTGPTTSTISVSPIINTNYTVTGNNGTCSNTKTTSVIVNPTPTVTANTASICSTQTATLTAAGATTYTWNPGGLSGTSVTVSPGASQNYTVTGTNGFGCISTGTGSVTVTATPTLVAPSSTICPGNTATLTVSGATTYTWNPGAVTGTTYTTAPVVNSTYTVIGTNGNCNSQQTVSVTLGGAISIVVNSPTICIGQNIILTASGAITYTWNTGANTNTISVTPTVTTTYTISGTSGACNGVNTSTVTVKATPTVAASAPAAMCTGQTVTLTANGATTYTWNPGGLSGTSVTVSPGATQNYTVTGTDAFGCTNTASTSVVVTATPTLAVNGATICTGATATLTAAGATSYTWNPGAVTGTTYTTAPVANATYTVLGANGTCTSVTTTSVLVGSALAISINSPTVCAGQSIVLTATSTAISYTWNPGGTVSNSISVTPTITTTYSVDGTNGVCNGTASTTVIVNALPTLTISGASICSGQTVTLTASGAATYTWLPGGTNGSVLTDTPTATTNYTVTGTLAGCNNTTSYNLTVTPTPTLSVNSPTICGGAATLVALGATNYTWTPGGLTTSSIVVSPTVNTTYTLDGTNGNCASSIVTSVIVSSAPPLVIALSNNIICSLGCINFSVNAGFSSVLYNYGDSPFTSTLTSHCYTCNGGPIGGVSFCSYLINATGTYSTGCLVNSSGTLAITVVETPTAAFSIINGTPQYVNTSVAFQDNSLPTSGYSAIWNLGNGTILNFPFGSVPSTVSNIYSSAGNYCIKLVITEAIGGCKDSTTQCVDIILPISISIPNVFTPNNDGTNDVFKISGTGINQFHCAIFDRWGLKMYEWDGIGGGWDGKSKSGINVPNGTYFYLIDYTTADGKSEKAKGPLSLFGE